MPRPARTHAMRISRPGMPSISMLLLALTLAPLPAIAKEGMDAGPQSARMRARDLGIVIGRYSPGPLNAITDVAGVKVGQRTLIRGNGPLVPGKGPVRTGV